MGERSAIRKGEATRKAERMNDVARKKQPTIIHPEALNSHHSDVGYLLDAVQSALIFLTDKSLDGRSVCDAVTPQFKVAWNACGAGSIRSRHDAEATVRWTGGMKHA